MKYFLALFLLIPNLVFAAPVCDGVTDDTVAIQNDLDNLGNFTFPANKTCRITAPVYLNKIIDVTGYGRNSVLFADFQQVQVGALVIKPTNIPAGTGATVSNFAIKSPYAPIYLDLSAGQQTYINRWKFDHLYLENTSGGYAFVLNNPTNTDGFFSSQITNNFSYGGYYLPRLGDSITIDNNTITGAGNGIQFDAVQGAANVIIRENNITSDGIAIFAGEYAQNTKILDNNIEHGLQVGAPIVPQMIVVYGSSTKKAYNTIIKGNMLHGHNTVDPNGSLIALGYVEDAVVDENRTLQGANTCVAIFNTAKRARIGKRNLMTCSTQIWNQPTSTTIME